MLAKVMGGTFNVERAFQKQNMRAYARVFRARTAMADFLTSIGQSDMRRILMPQDWEGHPLRKTFPLGYEEIQFSFNFDEIDKRKPYAKE